MNPNPQDSAVALEVERAAFEAHYCADAERQGFPMPDGIANLREENHYGGHRTMLNGKWEGWQARASLVTPSAEGKSERDWQEALTLIANLAAVVRVQNGNRFTDVNALLFHADRLLAAAPNQGDSHE